MKRILSLAAVCALAACGGTETNQADGVDTVAVTEVDPNADAGFEAIAPGEYEVVHADGRIDRLSILPGMTWAMVYADNSAAGGTIFAQDGQACFVTEGEDGQDCFAGSEPAADGSIQVTDENGAVATVRPAGSQAGTTTAERN